MVALSVFNAEDALTGFNIMNWSELYAAWRTNTAW